MAHVVVLTILNKIKKMNINLPVSGVFRFFLAHVMSSEIY